MYRFFEINIVWEIEAFKQLLTFWLVKLLVKKLSTLAITVYQYFIKKLITNVEKVDKLFKQGVKYFTGCLRHTDDSWQSSDKLTTVPR